jgi:hypothetical protein
MALALEERSDEGTRDLLSARGQPLTKGDSILRHAQDDTLSRLPYLLLSQRLSGG